MCSITQKKYPLLKCSAVKSGMVRVLPRMTTQEVGWTLFLTHFSFLIKFVGKRETHADLLTNGAGRSSLIVTISKKNRMGLIFIIANIIFLSTNCALIMEKTQKKEPSS